MKMTASRLDEVIAILPGLSPDEIKIISDRCAVLLAVGGKGKKIAEPPQFAADLYAAITSKLGLGMPFIVFMRTDYGALFIDAATAAEKKDAEWFPKQTRAEHQSICLLYAELIVTHIKSANLPLIWSVITRMVENLPAIVDLAFPGYAAAGLLGVVRERRTKLDNKPEGK